MPAKCHHVALLRGINVGGHAKVPMAELRQLCESLGWGSVTTLLNSGNVVFVASGPSAKLEAALETALAKAIGLEVPVIVRDARTIAELVAEAPFPEARNAQPKLVHLALSKADPKPDAATALQRLGAAGEQVTLAGKALWLHYPNGSGTSKITPKHLDQIAGSATTTRNWNTLLKIHALLSEA